MKVAVLGAGFAGLAVTYHLIRNTQGRARIDLFDPEPIGHGPSGISLGLLHPYMGRKAIRAWRATSSLGEVHALISVAAAAINEPIVISKGVLRPALSAEQAGLFKERIAENEEELEWLSPESTMERIPGLIVPPEGGGLYVKGGWTLNVQNYLQGLFRACLNHGVVFKQLRGMTEEVISKYDHIVVCLGANSLGFGAFKNLPMTAVKGQILRLKWPVGVPPLPMSIVGEKQIVMCPDYKSCLVGSTYEHTFKDFLAHKDQAQAEIMPKILSFFPALADAEVLECRAGFRASPTNRFPLCGRYGEKFWFLTGLGSRGLLYHGWLGKRMAKAIYTGSLDVIPQEVLYQGL